MSLHFIKILVKMNYSGTPSITVASIVKYLIDFPTPEI